MDSNLKGLCKLAAAWMVIAIIHHLYKNDGIASASLVISMIYAGLAFKQFENGVEP